MLYFSVVNTTSDWTNEFFDIILAGIYGGDTSVLLLSGTVRQEQARILRFSEIMREREKQAWGLNQYALHLEQKEQ